MIYIMTLLMQEINLFQANLIKIYLSEACNERAEQCGQRLSVFTLTRASGITTQKLSPEHILDTVSENCTPRTKPLWTFRKTQDSKRKSHTWQTREIPIHRMDREERHTQHARVGCNVTHKNTSCITACLRGLPVVCVYPRQELLNQLLRRRPWPQLKLGGYMSRLESRNKTSRSTTASIYVL